jgi:cell division septation protein DedD
MGMLLGATLLGACSAPEPSPDPESAESGARVYHVQLQFTEDKDQAESIMSRGLRWWQNQPASSRPPLVQAAPSSDAAVSIKWRTPFYRVRIGPFATEQQAETVLRKAQSTFPDAFVAPSRSQSP